jgi:hypothetical protein
MGSWRATGRTQVWTAVCEEIGCDAYNDRGYFKVKSRDGLMRVGSPLVDLEY